MSLIKAAKRVTIVGAGQVGATLTRRLLDRGWSVRLIDGGKRVSADYQQKPWGWFRVKSLQPTVRCGDEPTKFPFSAPKKYGPMIITSASPSVHSRWHEWISKTETDAKILESSDLRSFGINTDNRGFLCDSRDFIIDFNRENQELREQLSQHPRCEYIDNMEIQSIINFNGSPSILPKDEDNGLIIDDLVVVAAGNQNRRLLYRYPPVATFRLCFSKGELSPGANLPDYIALWNDKSSLTIFDDKNIKIGCGGALIFDSVGPAQAFDFSSLLLKGIRNGKINMFKSQDSVQRECRQELKDLSLPVEQIPNTFDSCLADITPTFLPIIDYIDTGLFVIGGFSGSGFTAYEDWFADAVEQSLLTGKTHPRLNSFSIRRTIRQNLSPKDEERSYVFG